MAFALNLCVVSLSILYANYKYCLNFIKLFEYKCFIKISVFFLALTIC